MSSNEAYRSQRTEPKAPRCSYTSRKVHEGDTETAPGDPGADGAPAAGLEPATVRLTDRILRESLDFMLWEVEIDDDFSFEAADSQ